MIDRFLLPHQARLLSGPARAIRGLGLSADQVSIIGFAIGLLALPAVALGQMGLAAALILVNRLGDGLDGEIARQGKPSARGAFLDITLDFLFYASIPLGFALADPAKNALPAAVLLAAFLGTGTSFLAFAALAASEGLSAKAYPTKGIYYLGGLTEGAETITFFLIACLFPAAFPVLALGFSAACLITITFRLHAGFALFDPSQRTKE